jgi:hypothetical protein
VDKGRLRTFLKNPLQKTWWTAQSEQKPAKNNERAANMTLSCKQASKMPSHILCAWEASAMWFRHVGHHFMKPGDFEGISVSKILHFVQGAELLNAWAKGLHERSIAVEVHRSLIFYSILLYSYVLL